MLAGVRDFIARHRRKFIVTGAVVGSAYIGIRYMQHKLVDFQERQAREYLEKTRRLQHFESTERTCNQVIIGMGSELSQAIILECSTAELLDQLHKNPQNLELWNEIKIVAFTRLTTFIYATSMLVVALRVQVNLLGGYLYQDIVTEKKQITNELRQRYLSLIRHFIQDGGISQLTRLIRSKVSDIIKPMPLNRPLSLSDLEQLFWSLQMAINSDVEDPNSKLSKYLMPSNQVPERNIDDPLLQKMFTETLDLLESDDAASVCSNNVCRGFSIAVDAIAESMTEITDPVKLSAGSSGEGNTTTSNSILNINSVQIPLAKVIPIVSKITDKGVDSTRRPQNLPTSLITFYVLAEKTKILGANVYESISLS